MVQIIENNPKNIKPERSHFLYDSWELVSNIRRWFWSKAVKGSHLWQSWSDCQVRIPTLHHAKAHATFWIVLWIAKADFHENSDGLYCKEVNHVHLTPFAKMLSPYETTWFKGSHRFLRVFSPQHRQKKVLFYAFHRAKPNPWQERKSFGECQNKTWHSEIDSSMLAKLSPGA